MRRSDLRVVIDANIVVSAMLSERSTTSQVVEFAIVETELLLSEEIEEELAEVLGRKKFDRYLPEETRFSFLMRFRSNAEFVPVTNRITECRDPKDNKYLELAVSGNATHIVTGDADLLVLNPFRGIAIVTAQEFLTSVTNNG